MPSVEVRPEPDLVRALLNSQYPRLAGEPVRFAALGWDNAMFRIGQKYAARLPIRRFAVPLILHEFQWVAEVASPLAALGIDASSPVFLGRPGHGYPWSWLVCKWVPGHCVATLPVIRRDQLAEDLTAALLALHRPAPPDAPANPHRGVPLADRATLVVERRRAVADQLGATATAALYGIWERGLAADPWQREPRWLHGDPHPHNLVHRSGRLAGFIDFGDLTAGDPASDLYTAWLTLNTAQRHRLRGVADASGRYDAAIWDRAAAWAAIIVTALLADESARVVFADVIAHAVDQLIS